VVEQLLLNRFPRVVRKVKIMTEIVNVTPAVIDQASLMAILSQMQQQLKAAEDRAAAAERKAEAIKTGSVLLPGVHPLGFNCDIAPDEPDNPDSPYREFAVDVDTIAYTGPQQVTVKGSAITLGPTLSYFQTGLNHAWTSARFRRSHDAYLSTNAGASSTKLPFAPELWLTHSAVGVYWQLLRKLVADQNVKSLWYRGKPVEDAAKFIAAVDADLFDWFQDLTPAKSSAKTRYQRGKR
jgi:hypothetical protein